MLQRQSGQCRTPTGYTNKGTYIQDQVQMPYFTSAKSNSRYTELFLDTNLSSSRTMVNSGQLEPSKEIEKKTELLGVWSKCGRWPNKHLGHLFDFRGNVWQIIKPTENWFWFELARDLSQGGWSYQEWTVNSTGEMSTCIKNTLYKSTHLVRLMHAKLGVWINTSPLIPGCQVWRMAELI